MLFDKQSKNGFTLVEVLIVVPLALLVITGFIAIMVTMVGNAISNNNRNNLAYDTQSALNMIEQDVRLSTDFIGDTGNLPSPQGKDGATAGFTSTAGDLILGEIATDKNPIDPTRGFIYYNAPFSCSDPAQVFKNRLFFNTVIYFVQNGSLWRRTIVPTASGTLCSQPWQVNSCAPGYSAASTQCKTNDSEVMDNVNSFSVNYYLNPQDTTPLSAGSITTASTIKATLNGEQSAAGRSFTSSSSMRVSKLSDRDITIPVPDAPVVSGSVSGPTASFTWPAVTNATSYIVTYNVNGGSWITASDNTTKLSFSVDGARGDTITIKVLARNTTGASADTTSNNKAVTIPRWTDCSLVNSWVNYGSGYENCGYTITKDGVVVLKGVIKNGSTASNVSLFTLPAEMRPSTYLMFQTVISPSASTRINVYSDGTVRLDNGTSSAYVGLDGIYFIPATSSLYNWTDLTLQNSWANYGGSWSNLQTTKDGSGRVHLRGLLAPGTTTADTVIAQLPAGSTVSEYYHISARGSDYNTLGINASGAIVARGVSGSSYVSTQTMFYPSTYGSWQSFTGAVAGNPTDGKLGNGWVTYGAPQTIPQYTKSPTDGIVTLKGLVKSGTTTADTYMAKLPAGYRPLNMLTFVVPSSTGVARVDVDSNGYIIFRAGTNTWMSLDDISYVAEQ